MELESIHASIPLTSHTRTTEPYHASAQQIPSIYTYPTLALATKGHAHSLLGEQRREIDHGGFPVRLPLRAP
jgi:hypothetical protein